MYFQTTRNAVLFATTPDALPVVRGWGGDYYPVPVSRYGISEMKSLAREGYTAQALTTDAALFAAAFNAL